MSSSFLMNSSPAAYPTGAVDPKFPPTEEYSQGNYIPDYYGTNVQSLGSQPHHLSHHPNPHHPYGAYHHHLNYIDQSSVQSHPYHHGHPSAIHPSHHGHHNSLGGLGGAGPASSLAAQQHQYFSPCSMSPMGPGPGPAGPLGGVHPSQLHHSLGQQNSVQNHPISPLHQSPLAPNQMPHLSSRVSSPLLPRTPSPHQANSLGLDPPSPGDCGVSTHSGSDSGTGNGNGHPVIYPWMKKVHVNQGKGGGKYKHSNIQHILYNSDSVDRTRGERQSSVPSICRFSQ